jgi:hypothetical protein
MQVDFWGHFRVTGSALKNWLVAQLEDSLAVGLLNRGAVQSLSLRPRDFVGRSVLFPLEAFELRQYPTSSSLERGEILELAR